MPLLNFKQRFVEPIRLGAKAHTIRADRHIPIKAGDNLYLYCQARTKACFRILAEPVVCTKVEPISIRECGLCGGTGERACSSTHYESCPAVEVIVGDRRLEPDEQERLAVADGFATLTEFFAFWEGRLPFKGQIIHWTPPAVSHA